MCVGKAVCESHNIDNKTKKVCLMGGNREEYSEDLLALTTKYTKIALFTLGRTYGSFSESKWHKIIFGTTQPAHLATVFAILSLGFLLLPNEVNHRTASPLVALLYLGSFSIHLGAQIWMTFVSGLSLYFCLPRHTFGRVQRVLFPKYFLLNSILSFVTLSAFLHCNSFDLRNTSIIVQSSSLVVCFLTEFLIYLYLTPPLLTLMEEKNKLEEKVGVGMEIGKQDLSILVNDKYYLKIHKAFRSVHIVIAMGNIAAIGCSTVQLVYLANKLCVL